MTGGTGGGGVSTGASVLERNNHPNRDGHFLQPTITKAKAATMARDTAFTAAFSGSMMASPLYFENGPGGKGIFIAVTTGNDVFALDETTGAVVWTRNIGSSPTANGVSCGNVHPLGIISTPVIDATSRTLFVAGAIGTTSIVRHDIHAMSLDDGTERAGWPVDASKLTAATPTGGTLAFNPPPQNQRSALSLVNGILYVAFGGHAGDCGVYHGWVVAISAANPATRVAWASTDQGEAIWAPGGMASDGTSLFAITGDRRFGPNAGSATHGDSEQVMRITGMAAVTRNNSNIFYPTSWRTMDSADADFGSSNPLYISVPGATPVNYVAAISKDGHLYLLDSANLGGIGGQLVDFRLANGGAMIIHTVPIAYSTPMGVHVALSTDSNAVCPAGMATGKVIMSALIPAGSPPAPRTLWCAPLVGTVTAPISTTTNGTADAIVWYMSNNKLTGVDGDTGTTVFTSTDTCAGVNKWTSPIAVKGRIVTGADGHLCSWSVR